jgi:hypothetical protein
VVYKNEAELRAAKAAARATLAGPNPSVSSPEQKAFDTLRQDMFGPEGVRGVLEDCGAWPPSAKMTAALAVIGYHLHDDEFLTGGLEAHSSPGDKWESAKDMRDAVAASHAEATRFFHEICNLLNEPPPDLMRPPVPPSFEDVRLPRRFDEPLPPREKAKAEAFIVQTREWTSRAKRFLEDAQYEMDYQEGALLGFRAHGPEFPL